MRSLKCGAFFTGLCVVALAQWGEPRAAARSDQHLLYVATPGIRNYVEYGGIGLVVYDMDNGHRFVKRIPTFDLAAGEAPENVKGQMQKMLAPFLASQPERRQAVPREDVER